MAYTSEPQDPMGDEYMEEFGLTNEMLSPQASQQSSLTAEHLSVTRPQLPHRVLPFRRRNRRLTCNPSLDIFQLDEELPDESDGNELDEDDGAEEVDLEDQRQRTERLRGIYPALDRLWWTGSEYMVGAAEKLADGSRDRKSSWIVTSHRSPIPKSMTPTSLDYE